ncbi:MULTISPECIES: hypothetical protein [Kitasatospora]|nr:MULTISPECIES: hypothetical protein [Kitasatospora]
MRIQERARTRARTQGRVRGRAGGRGRSAAATALAALLLLGTAAPQAAADPSPAASAPSAAGAPAAQGQLPDTATQAERLAAALRQDPVYVSVDLPRETPRSLAPRFAEIARRIGVPTYVLVLPDADASLLAQVHDRLGASGLYVLVERYGVTATGFGVDLPVDDAARVARHTVPYDAGRLAQFEAFAEKLALGADQLAAQVRQIYADGDHEVPERYISATDRQNQNLLIGLAVVLVPGLLLVLGLFLARRRADLRPAPAAVSDAPRRPVRLDKKPGVKPGAKSGAKAGKAPASASAPGWRYGVLAVTLVATVAAVAGVLLAAPQVFAQRVDGPDLRVTPADLAARSEEAAAALTAGGVYQDAAAPTVLSPAQLAAVKQRTAELAASTPVFLLFTGSDSDDESTGDGSRLLAQVRQRTGLDGVYVQVDPVAGYFELVEFRTAATDVETRFRRAELRYPERENGSGDLRIPERLNRVLDTVAAARPTGREGDTGAGSTLPELHDNALPPLFKADLVPGTLLGALLLGILTLVGWACSAAVRAGRVRRAVAAAVAATAGTDAADAASGVSGPGGARRASAHPTVRQLRAWATEDVRALATRLAAAGPDEPGRARAWDCLDAAGLLLGEDGEGGAHGTRGARGARGDADPADLAAAVVLAQAGQAVLGGRSEQLLCRANPLHGPATGGRVPSWFAELGLGPKAARICPHCRESFRAGGADRPTADRTARRFAADQRLLRVPDPDGRTSSAWHEAGQVLPAALDGIDALVLRARESASVQ